MNKNNDTRIFLLEWQKWNEKELHENQTLQGKLSRQDETSYIFDCILSVHADCGIVFQFDLASLVPLELFYFKTGVNPLLRLPRLLKVRLLLHIQPSHFNNSSFSQVKSNLFV